MPLLSEKTDTHPCVNNEDKATTHLQSQGSSADAPPLAYREQSERNNNFNFIRLLFACLVILSHSWEFTHGTLHPELLRSWTHSVSFGDIAVDGFFILSGLLITQSWLRSQNFWDYFKKRILRIYPGYFVAYLVSLFIVGPLGAANVTAYFASVSWKGTIGCLLQMYAPFTPVTLNHCCFGLVNGALWTISYEFRCYVLVALLGAIGVYRRAGQVLALFGALLICSLLPDVFQSNWVRIGSTLPGRYLLFVLGTPKDFLRLSTFFLAGMCFSLYQKRIRFSRPAVLAAAVLSIAALFVPRLTNVLLATAGCYVLMHLAYAPSSLLRNFGKRPDVSYGVYLYGWPITALFVFFLRGLDFVLLFPLTLLCGIGAGYLSWTFVEKPALRLKNSTLFSFAFPQRRAAKETAATNNIAA